MKDHSFTFMNVVTLVWNRSDQINFQLYSRFNEDKRDPLFENLSTEELYRMLQLIDMAADDIPVSASDRELFQLNMLLEDAGIQANP